MKAKITYLIIAWIAFGSSRLLANQGKADSLLALLKNEKTDTGKVVLLRKLYSLHANSDPVKAQEYAEKALSLSRTCKYPTGEAGALISLGEIYRKAGNFEKADSVLNIALQLSFQHNLLLQRSFIFNNMGEVSRMKGDYKQALKNYHASLKIKEDLGEEVSASNTLNNIGLVHLEQKQYKEALLYFERSLKIREKLGLRNRLGVIFTNLGRIYLEQKNYSFAMESFQKSLLLDREFGNRIDEVMDLNNIGEVHLALDQPDSAFSSYEKAYLLCLELNDPYTQTLILVNQGSLLLKQEKHTAAQKKFLLAIQLGEEGGFGELLEDAYLLYSESLYATNKYETAFTFHQKYTSLKDSLFNAENLRQVNEIQAKYETTRKDKELLLQKAEIEKAESINRRRDLERNAMLFGCALVAALVFFIIRGYRLQRKNNHQILLQKEILEEKQKEILDSIRYARRIQNGMMPNEKNLHSHLKRLRSVF